MYIQKVSIKNFRLLADVDMCLEPRTTVIVGRNNCGKTSLSELFRRVLSDRGPAFRLEDFSICCHEEFWRAYQSHLKNEPESDVRAILPKITLKIVVAYDKGAPVLGPLGDFVIDLDEECTTAEILLEYRLKAGRTASLFGEMEIGEIADEKQKKRIFFRSLRANLCKEFELAAVAVDPTDSNNSRPVDLANVRDLLFGSFINAQRGLDDTTQRDVNLLGKVLEGLLNAAMADTADEQERDIACKLETAVREMQDNLDAGFNQRLQQLIPAFTLFGYPGLSDPNLMTETSLDITRLLADHTAVRYAGANGVNLPETYSGLGTRNLVLILLKLYEFYRAFRAKELAPGAHLVFIEEPEVHLHPQMQEVFIRQLSSIVDAFSKQFAKDALWPVQFIVSTHSSHIANKASFEAIRYFLSRDCEDGGRTTVIKDLRSGLEKMPFADKEFLHKYMTLTRCDLFFADKAILIEGPSERLMLPRMIEVVDGAEGAPRMLASEYLSIVEVGGAYAHLFFGLIDFLELKTLIVTDMDSVAKGSKGQFRKCKVSSGTRTSNACIRSWFGDETISPKKLLKIPDASKTQGTRRIAFQVPEHDGAACGRSFEEAFILANPDLFEIAVDCPDREDVASQIASEWCESKTDFALKYAVVASDWKVPKYIEDGLVWLGQSQEGASEATDSEIHGEINVA